ncbi:MAG: DUF1311 domain-containing protein [Alphaproteobacteria bacterium]|nr:DUF1311 domain-containing protein [Alphaproteobacteria bacterium]
MFLAAGAAAAQTPSFDCGKARTRVEQAICGDQRLAAADREMADLYRARLAAGDAAATEALRRDQQAWLRQRGQCEQHPAGSPAIVACVAALLTARIVVLRPVAAAPAAPPAPAPAAASAPAGPAPRAEGPPVAAAGWTAAAADGACTLARESARGRRFAIERGADAGADRPGTATFRAAAGEDDLVVAGDRVVLIVDQQRIPATVPVDGPPRAVVPAEREAAAIRLFAAGRTLAVVRQIDTLLEVPLAGFADAYRDFARRCGFDPAPFL